LDRDGFVCRRNVFGKLPRRAAANDRRSAVKFSPVKVWLMFVLLVVGAYGAYSGWRIYQRLETARSPAIVMTPVTEPLLGQTIEPFELTDQSGEPFDSRQLDGQIWVASFFFSSCPGACLKMNYTIARLQEELRETGVRFISVTVDPEQDTPETLEKYARHFAADPQVWTFLTGPEDDLKRLAMEQFKVAFGRGTHSEKLFVVDRDGQVRGGYNCTTDAQMILLKRKIEELAKRT
jgi:cytochrome oxidase Cu insertion factor (SCO1/SenC/PrrC family)